MSQRAGQDCGKVVVVGPGLRGPAAGHAGGRGGLDRSSASTSTSTGSSASTRASPTWRTCPRPTCCGRWSSGPLPAVRSTRPPAPTSTWPSSPSPRPCATAPPTCPTSRQGTATVARYLRPGATVVLESTTYPGTTEELVAPILEAGSGLDGRHRLPPRLQPRAHRPRQPRVRRWSTRPRSSRASTPPPWPRCRRFYDSIVDTTVPVSNPKVAEMTKLLENTFRHVNIALVNELAMFAADLGVDVWEAIDAASTKPFGFMRFTPGPGVGGHCLPIDPSYLSWRVRRLLGQPFRFVELANDVNDHMPDYVVQRLVAGPQPQAAGGQRQPHPAPRAGLQAQHQRRPRVAGGGGGRAPARPRRRGAGRRPPRGRGPHRRPGACG